MQIIKNTEIILPCHYLPNMLYMKKLLLADKAIIEIHQNFTKQTYSNRCNILSANGIQTLSIPTVKIHHTKQTIAQVRISYEENWQKQHWLALQSAYGKSAFWLYYKDYFESFYLKHKYEFLHELNNGLLLLLLKLLKTETSTQYSNSFEENYINTNDLRQYFHAKKQNLQEQEEASKLKKYLQVFAEKFHFEANLSVIDLLMNLGPQSKNYLLNG